MKATSMTMLLMAALFFVAAWSLAQAADKAAPKHTNRLAKETSPYLLQHAHNPVDWYPWGKEAFERAKKEDKPIFLSVGYSTCHWCHVMAHESFEDEAVAKVMNEHFVCIKVDREELPDVDEQYMLATQLFTRRGGWPNSVVLTPDGRPWFAGTYFPKSRFIPLLQELARVWKDQRKQVEEQADSFAAAIREAGKSGGQPQARVVQPTAAIVSRAVEYFRSGYDEQHGGIGSAPKFPPHGAVALWLDAQKLDNDLKGMSVLTHTLDAMSMGGIYDHVGGGFHRYSTDARWFLPHFEKMLYDNAQLIRAYAGAYELTGVEDYKRVVAETFDWLQREMLDPAGSFYSALDADSEGEEGKFYVWTQQEIVGVLGETDAALFNKTYNVTREGSYHEEASGHATGANIPFLSQPLPADEATREKLRTMREKLRQARDKRVRPHLDDKVLTSWNGLMIGSLAYAGRVLDEPKYTEAAKRAGDFVLRELRTKEGKLLRTWRKGEAKIPGYLDDYAYLIEGLLELHGATKESRWLDAARPLADTMIAEFYDAKNGGFYSTSAAHDTLLLRGKELGGGGNQPSGNGVAADVLLRLALLTGETKYADASAATLRHFAATMASQPHGSEAMILVLSHYLEAAKTDKKLKLRERLNPPATASSADSVAGESPVVVEVFVSQVDAAPGNEFLVAVVMKIDEGYHIYAHDVDPKTQLIATKIELIPTPELKAGEIRWPKPHTLNDPVLKQPLSTYEGVAAALLPVTVAADAAEGGTVLKLRFKAQACDDKACYPPVDYELTVPIVIGKQAGKAKRHEELFKKLRLP